jgi:predicted transcriptional regulator of viral defense system
MPVPAASHALSALAGRNLVVRLRRGLWASRLAPGLSPYEVVGRLQAPWPACVSLLSALADHGVIEEVPDTVYAVTSGPPRRFRTPLGSYRLHHLPSRLMWGYGAVRAGPASYNLADPEKAFLDQVYLALVPRSPIGFPPRRGRSWSLDRKRLRVYAIRFSSRRLTGWLKKEGLI